MSFLPHGKWRQQQLRMVIVFFPSTLFFSYLYTNPLPRALLAKKAGFLSLGFFAQRWCVSSTAGETNAGTGKNSTPSFQGFSLPSLSLHLMEGDSTLLSAYMDSIPPSRVIHPQLSHAVL